MTTESRTITKALAPIASYFVKDVKFPFCKGCGHTNILRRLNEALVELQLSSRDVALVTDIGCIGLSDGLFEAVHTVHTTHGRSTAFATGIALADSVLADRRLKIIVLIGDGGAMIGLQHLVHAAMLNVDVTVLVCNNFVYGMTGGQSSSFTPEEFLTSTTPKGNIVPPADLCEILRHSGAPFVARTLATDRELPSILRQAIDFLGFAVVEILELCTEFAVPANELTGKKLLEEAEKNRWKLGILESRADRALFVDRYERTNGAKELSHSEQSSVRRTKSAVVRRAVSIVVAGSAGEGVQSASSLLCQAALSANLYVTQKNDNPVTQGSGFSLSEIWLSPRPVGFTGIEKPDFILVSSEDGLRELGLQGWMDRLSPKTRMYLDDTVDPTMVDDRIVRVPLRSTFGPRSATLGGLALMASEQNIVDPKMLVALAADRYGERTASGLTDGLKRLSAGGGAG